MWIIVAGIIGGLAVLLVLLLSMPFDLAAGLDYHGRLKYSLKWAWAFGLVSREVRFRKRAPAKPAKPKKPGKARKKSGLKTTLDRIRFALDLIRTRGLLGHIGRLARRTLRRLNIRRLEAEWFVGLENPDETFYLFMLTEPFNRLLNYRVPYPVSIRPCFIEAAFEGYLELELRLFPIRLALPMIQFVFSVPVFRVMRKVVTAWWRRNR